MLENFTAIGYLRNVGYLYCNWGSSECWRILLQSGISAMLDISIVIGYLRDVGEFYCNRDLRDVGEFYCNRDVETGIDEFS